MEAKSSSLSRQLSKTSSSPCASPGLPALLSLPNTSCRQCFSSDCPMADPSVSSELQTRLRIFSRCRTDKVEIGQPDADQCLEAVVNVDLFDRNNKSQWGVTASG